MLQRLGILGCALLCLVVLGCSREDPLIANMRREIKTNAGMLIGIIGEGRAFAQNDGIWTEYSITVKRSDRVAYPPGSTLKVYRRGGSVIEGTTPDGQPIVRQMIVDDGVIMPSEAQSEVFIVLRAQGDRLVVLDAVPVKAGQFAVDRPFNVLYKETLSKLAR